MTFNQIRQQSIQSLEKTNLGMGLDKFSKRVLSLLIKTARNTLVNSIDVLISHQKMLSENARQKAIRCGDSEKEILEKMRPYTAKINDQAGLRA